MKNIFFLLPLLLINILVYSQNEEKIYENIINDFVLKYRQPNFDYTAGITLILLEKPAYVNRLNLEDYSSLKKKYKKLDQQTFLDFIERNQIGLQHWETNISNIEFVFQKKETLPTWKDLITAYPNWNQSILEFSNIGFNNGKKQAFVYYGYARGSTGGGFYIIYEKKKKKWKRKKIIPAWAT